MDHCPANMRLQTLIDDVTATVGVIGLGYVGLPLATSCATAGYRTVGFDIDSRKIELIGNGVSYIDGIDSGSVSKLIKEGTVEKVKKTKPVQFRAATITDRLL